MKEPGFIQDDSFKSVLYRPVKKGSIEDTTGQVTGQVTIEVEKLVLVLTKEMKRAEIQQELQLKHREYFVDNYMKPALGEGYVEMKFPNSPNHPQQKYRLTKKGDRLKKHLSE